MIEDDLPPIHQAVEQGDAREVSRLLLADPQLAHMPVSASDPNQPLHLAAWQGHQEIAILLLEAGAAVNVEGDLGRTPLHYAAKYGNLAVAKLLVQHGAKLEVKDRCNMTPLLTAAYGRERECEEVAEFLLASGAELDLQSALGLSKVDRVRSMLHGTRAAVQNALLPKNLLTDVVLMILGLLTAHDVRGPYQDREKAMRLIAEHIDILKTILEQGVVITPSCNALFYAVQLPDTTVAELLLKHGVPVEHRDHSLNDLCNLAKCFPAADEMIKLLRSYDAK